MVTIPEEPDDETTAGGIFSVLAPQDGIVHQQIWRNRTKRNFLIDGTYWWVGLGGGVKFADVWEGIVHHTASGNDVWMGSYNWDHYAQPTGPTGVWVWYPQPWTIRPGETVTLNYYTASGHPEWDTAYTVTLIGRYVLTQPPPAVPGAVAAAAGSRPPPFDLEHFDRVLTEVQARTHGDHVVTGLLATFADAAKALVTELQARDF